MTSRRINARLSAAVAGKVAALRGQTGKSTTAIIVEALNRYHTELEQRGGDPADILERNGFLACAGGPTNLSRHYKAQLAASLRKKT
jgi:hypothetical protein